MRIHDMQIHYTYGHFRLLGLIPKSINILDSIKPPICERQRPEIELVGLPHSVSVQGNAF